MTMTTSKNTINFLALTLVSIEVPVADRKACPNCGDPDCGSEDRFIRAKLFTEAERDIALALLDGSEDLSSPVPPFNGESSAIGRHFKGGKTCVFEIHHNGAPRAALQSFALDQAMMMFRRVVWQGPRVDGDISPEGMDGVLSYETPAIAVAA
jgi:hypothetical protein